MKPLPVALALLLSGAAALAVDARWTLGYGQGTLEANIENSAGSTFSIYCPAGSEDKTPGMFISVTRIQPQVKEAVTAQIIIDGKNHPILLDGSQFKAEGARTSRTSDNSSPLSLRPNRNRSSSNSRSVRPRRRFRCSTSGRR